MMPSNHNKSPLAANNDKHDSLGFVVIGSSVSFPFHIEEFFTRIISTFVLMGKLCSI